MRSEEEDGTRVAGFGGQVAYTIPLRVPMTRSGRSGGVRSDVLLLHFRDRLRQSDRTGLDGVAEQTRLVDAWRTLVGGTVPGMKTSASLAHCSSLYTSALVDHRSTVIPGGRDRRNGVGGDRTKERARTALYT